MKKLKEKQVFVLGEQEIDLDPDKLKFNEQTISDYYQNEGGNYDYYSSQLAYADFLLSKRELAYDVIYNEKFASNKELGGSDKYVEAKTKSDEDVFEAKEDVITAKYKKSLLQQHIRSWDRNHDNALNLGHMLRKEMDKLGMDLKGDRVAYEEEMKAGGMAPELDLGDLKS